MKTKLLIILVITGMLIFIMSNQFADARCAPNPDWPLAPCYDEQRSPIPTDQDKSVWSKYYDYKGAEFMESKKTDMLGALRSGKLCEWESEGLPFQNHNVLTYYFVNKVVSSNDCNTATELYYAGRNANEMLDTEPGSIEEKLEIARKPMIQESYKAGSSQPFRSVDLFAPIIIGIMISVGSFFGLTIYWRKRK